MEKFISQYELEQKMKPRLLLLVMTEVENKKSKYWIPTQGLEGKKKCRLSS